MADRETVNNIAEHYVDEHAALEPFEATYAGLSGYDGLSTDFSPDGFAERVRLDKQTLAKLENADAGDERERVSVAAMRERLGLNVEMYEVGLDRSLNVISSPVQWQREVFDLMLTDTEEQWADIGARLRAVPSGLAGYRQTMLSDIADSHIPAKRQVSGVIKQCERISGGFFTDLVASAPDGVRSGLESPAADAGQAYADFGRFLSDEVAPNAVERDAVGRDTYPIASRYFLGAAVDLEETYEWGIAELARIEQEMQEVAQQITPGGSAEDAIKALEADPARKISGTGNLQAWMQELSDRTVAALADTHFDIPDPIKRLECRIAPTEDGGIYYTGPSDDFSRPGRMWWSVAEGVEDFSTWQETTTVFHEGVPGHHLQIAQVVYQKELFNRWRRLFCWVSGHGEGWALYAERLMADLGFLDDPGDRMGMLDSQALRAARVVVDIGVHLGLQVPQQFVSEGLEPGAWTAESAWTFLRTHTRTPEEMLRFELDRYMGWPGQAPSYKVGERIWLAAREDARRRDGDAFDLKAFHRSALNLGSLGLDLLRESLARPS